MTLKERLELILSWFKKLDQDSVPKYLGGKKDEHNK
jgi:hypothetical protein